MSTIRRSRRLMAVGSTLAIATVLAACGGSDGGDTGDAGAPITLLSSGDADTTTGQGKAYTDILAAFTEDTGIEASLERVPFDQFLASATTKARAGALGDIVEMLPGENFSSLFPSLVDISKDDVADADALAGWESSLKDAGADGVYAGVPIGAQGVVWYYNKALFTEAGLDPEAPPATWDDLLTACDSLNSAGISPLGMSGGDSFILWWAWSSLSPQFFTAEDVNAVRSGEISLDDSRFKDSLTPLLETYERGCWNEDFAGKAFTDLEADFAAGKVAMVPGIISNAINWQVWDEKLGVDAYGVFGAPTAPGATSDGQFFNPVLIYGVSTESENPAGAFKLIEAISSVEGQETLLREASQFPNRTDVDVVGITGSKGAGQILEIVDTRGGVDVAQNQFNGAAQSASWSNLTQTILSGGIDGFLADLEAQQRG